MNIPKLTNNLEIIQKLSDLPNSTEGLTADQLKAKFDEAGLAIQKWLNDELVPSIIAENIPFEKTAVVNADTVQAAILEVQKQIADSASGAIINGTVTKEKLAASLLERVYGGRVWVSLDTPDTTDTPSSDFPVGQIWLRPSFTLKNKNTGNWQASGCSVGTSGNNVTISGSRTATTATATQSLSGAARAGDRIFVLFDMGSLDTNATEFTVSVNGGPASNAKNGGTFSAVANGALATVTFRTVWPSTSLAGGKTTVRNFTVINVDEILREASGANDMSNWGSFLRDHMPISENHVTDALYIQKDSGAWWQLGFPTLPVSRGGTGMTEVGDGELLYSKNGSIARLGKPANGMILQFSNGSPTWTDMSIIGNSGFARITTGSYVGNAEARTITLPVTPKLLVVDGVALQDGVPQTKTLYGTTYEGGRETYTAGIRLSGNRLTTYKSGGDHLIDAAPKAWNESGTTYKWVAIY
jgi:hypothetical protein